MATYAIGDVQACFESLQQLLEKIHFNPKQDKLWFVGDLVNRGPDSLSTLRFVKKLSEQKAAITVLGNHDLHLIAVSCGARELKKHDTFSDVLSAPDATEILNWLRAQPLFYYDNILNYALVHAGLAPFWTLEDALNIQTKISHILNGPDYKILLQHMYSTEPVNIHSPINEWQRCRAEIDYLTRLRFCTAEGIMDLKNTGTLADQPPGYYPWFRVPHRATQNLRIIFGHWAALQGNIDDPNIFALDTGCVWGNCLTAMRLEDQQRFSIPCK